MVYVIEPEREITKGKTSSLHCYSLLALAVDEISKVRWLILILKHATLPETVTE
jgi:hypothetical protein